MYEECQEFYCHQPHKFQTVYDGLVLVLRVILSVLRVSIVVFPVSVVRFLVFNASRLPVVVAVSAMVCVVEVAAEAAEAFPVDVESTNFRPRTSFSSSGRGIRDKLKLSKSNCFMSFLCSSGVIQKYMNKQTF